MTRYLAVVLTLAVPAAPAEHAPVAAASAPARVRVVTSVPAQGTRWVAGSLAAVRRAVVSTRTAASVRAVEVQEGARVRQGALLVRLSDDDVRTQLAAAKTALSTAAAQERRMEALTAQRAAAAIELDQARAQRAQAEAAVSAGRAALGYTEIRAPFAGTVQARLVNAGDLVGPGQPLLELEGSELEVVASLSEEEARGIAIGQNDAVRGRGSGRRDAGLGPGRRRRSAVPPSDAARPGASGRRFAAQRNLRPPRRSRPTSRRRRGACGSRAARSSSGAISRASSSWPEGRRSSAGSRSERAAAIASRCAPA
jgi:multidrug resistance efflux pump